MERELPILPRQLLADRIDPGHRVPLWGLVGDGHMRRLFVRHRAVTRIAPWRLLRWPLIIWGSRFEQFCFRPFFEDVLRHTLPVEAIIFTDHGTVAAPPHIGGAVLAVQPAIAVICLLIPPAVFRVTRAGPSSRCSLPPWK